MSRSVPPVPLVVPICAQQASQFPATLHTKQARPQHAPAARAPLYNARVRGGQFAARRDARARDTGVVIRALLRNSAHPAYFSGLGGKLHATVEIHHICDFLRGVPVIKLEGLAIRRIEWRKGDLERARVIWRPSHPATCQYTHHPLVSTSVSHQAR